MRIPIAKEGWPFAFGILFVFALAGFALSWAGWRGPDRILLWVGGALALFVLFFFRDPERKSDADSRCLLSGADGFVRSVERIREDRFLKTDTVRISVFLSIFDVHVNRAPVSGRVLEVQHTPGRKLFAFLDAASEYNEHNSILIDAGNTRCLVRQIVGPVARRVVSWLKPGDAVARGQRLGIMKFGSRLDVYLPVGDVEVRVKKGDRVAAGRTPLAMLTKENGS
jgi:phosphatidylserine decarboxylase